MAAMMNPGETNTDYCRRRAAEERAAAEHAADERAAQSHRDLARYFDELASGAARSPPAGQPIQSAGGLPSDFRIIP
jgi:hypothetical protein